MYFSTICVATLIAAVNALTFTSPTEGQNLDPQQAITVTWESSSSDPATFDLAIEQPGGLYGSDIVGTGISASAGSFVVPANTLVSYGADFVVKAQNSAGEVLATSPSFSLSTGLGPSANGEATATAQTALGVTNTMTNGAPSTSGVTAGNDASTTLSGSMTGFSTSTTSASSTTSHSSSTRASSSSSSSATTSANAQPRLASNSQIAFSAAGLLAGLAALLA